MAIKQTLDQVKKVFADRGCVFTDAEYKGAQSKCNYIAACSHVGTVTYSNFVRGWGYSL